MLKLKTILTLFIIAIAMFLLFEQAKLKPNVWIQAICIAIFIYGMVKLSSKTPSKNNNNDE